MELATILIGFAQIAIALAGFTTIASVVVQISERTSANLVAARLGSILTFSMLLVVMSVLLIAFYHLVTQGDQFWHYAAIGSLIVSSLAAYINFFHVIPKVVKDPHNSWLQTISSLVFALGGSASLVLTLLRDNPAFWYFAAMTLTLAACLTMIIGFVLSFPVFDVLRKSEVRGTENS